MAEAEAEATPAELWAARRAAQAQACPACGEMVEPYHEAPWLLVDWQDGGKQHVYCAYSCDCRMDYSGWTARLDPDSLPPRGDGVVLAKAVKA